MDLKNLERDSEYILLETLKHNKYITAKKTLDKTDQERLDPDVNDDDDTGVVVWDDIVLTEAKLDLLSLGPGFMVVEAMKKQDMRIESNATMTKIR